LWVKVSTKVVMSATLVTSTSFYLYYRNFVAGKPILYCREGSDLYKLLHELKIIKEEYRPTFWCYEPRLQTILASLVRHTLPDIAYRREVVTFTDGGQAGLDWHGEGNEEEEVKKENSREEETEQQPIVVKGEKEKDDSQPIVVILPGLTGSSQSEYVKTFVNVAREQVGARCCVFNYRGRGGCHLTTPRTYCASDSRDLKEILEHLQRSHPGAPVLAVGISLGGIILGNYLASSGVQGAGYLTAALLVSVCFDTFAGCSSLESNYINSLLNTHLTKALVESIRTHRHHFESPGGEVDMEEVFASTTFREFDTRFTAPVFGYSSCQEYYTHARLATKLGQIKVRTLALNALDDPFQPGASIPKEEAARSSHVAILATQYGGHIGFMEGSIPTRYHYSDRVFSEYLKVVFSSPHPAPGL